MATFQEILLRHPYRFNLLNFLIDCNFYTTYLEIGVEGGITFDNVVVPYKIGVDPGGYPATHQMTSDVFFRDNHDRFDLIFIDGLHTHYQSAQDLKHALDIISPLGTIILHDCLPTSKEITGEPYGGPWTGDVWKTILYYRTLPLPIRIRVINMDWGCAIIEPAPKIQKTWPLNQNPANLDYSYYEQHVKEYVEIVSVKQFIETYRRVESRQIKMV